MAVRLSRRAGPGHPALFEPSLDIPWPPRPPALPRASAAIDVEPFRAVLAAAEAITVAELSHVALGRSVTIGGLRLAADPLLPGDALIDDGSAVAPLVISDNAAPTLRAALAQRFLVATGTVTEREGFVTLEAHDVRDLRQLNRDWKTISRR